MLVQRLVEHARRDEAAMPFHRSREFQWELRLDEDGRPVSDGIESLLEPDAKGKLRGPQHMVPSSVRTVGVAPNLAADDVQYVLGWADSNSNTTRVEQCHAAFVDLTERWAASPDGDEDPVAQAVAGFYRSGELARLRRPDEFTSKQGVVITVGATRAYQAESVPGFWSVEVARRKGGGTQGLCLACGGTAPLLDTVPGKVPSRLVPGASNDAALVSINKRVFGYDLTTQLGCSPLCILCGEAMSAGLVRVLGSPNTASYGGQDSRLAWWVTEPVASNPMKLIFDADPSAVSELLRTVHTGHKPHGAAENAKFCALTVGGNIARVMVRDWLEMPLDQLETNIAAWFDDHQVTTLHDNEPDHHPLEKLVRVAGRWLRKEKRYAFIGAKGADRPDGLQHDLLRSAMRNVPVPPSVLAHLVHRVRTDGRLDTPRAALIRLALLRSPLISEKPMPGLDDQNTNAAYVAGRAFAVLEFIQYDVSDGKLNTTYGDRYFAGAITNPRTALINGRKDANAWLRKLRKRKPGAAINHEKTLDALFGLIAAGDGIPSRANLKQQSLFLLGYHHQRAHRFAAARSTSNTSQETAE